MELMMVEHSGTDGHPFLSPEVEEVPRPDGPRARADRLILLSCGTSCGSMRKGRAAVAGATVMSSPGSIGAWVLSVLRFVSWDAIYDLGGGVSLLK